MALQTAPSRAWELRKQNHCRTLADFAVRSPNLDVLGTEDLEDEQRLLLRFRIRTLVKPPGGPVGLAGPVIAGIRYHRDFLSRSPIPWEIVTLLSPLFIFLPSVNPAGGLCLGHPVPGISLEQILHACWAALTVHTRLTTLTDWQVFNPEAAACIRHAEPGRFPLTPRGLLEPPETAAESIPFPATERTGGAA